MSTQKPVWFKDAIFYQIYPQTFYDTNNDGIGDIRGIIEKLDYIKSLGVNAIWLNPCFESPFRDAGYDIADFYQVAKRYGTNDDLKELFNKAHERDIRVLLDLVPGHTSTECEWFKKSSAHAKSEYDDWYIWTENTFTDTAKMRFIGGYSERNGQYLTNFFYCQPALNFGFSNPDPKYSWQVLPNAPGPMAVKNAIKDIIRYWLEMGASGFRVDMAFSLVKKSGQSDVKIEASPETSEFWNEVRNMLDDEFPEAVLISEWFRPGQALSAGFHSDFVKHSFIFGLRNLLGLGPNKTRNKTDIYGDMPDSAEELFKEFYQVIKQTEDLGYISLFSCNHDLSRAKQDGVTDVQLETYFAILMTLPGIPFVYYGDEIGMQFIDGLPSIEGGYNRCGSRTPMQWNQEKNAGFSSVTSDNLYLPIDSDTARPDVESQEKDRNSLLNNVKNIIALRKKNIDFAPDADFKILNANNSSDVVAYSRGENTICVFNLTNIEQNANMICELGESYNVLASSDSNCNIRLKNKQLHLSLAPRSYGIIKFVE